MSEALPTNKHPCANGCVGHDLDKVRFVLLPPLFQPRKSILIDRLVEP